MRPQANGALMLHPGSMVFLHKTTRASSVLCSRDHVMIRSDAHRVTVMLTLGHWLYAALTAHFRNSCPVQDSCTVTDERALPCRCACFHEGWREETTRREILWRLVASVTKLSGLEEEMRSGSLRRQTWQAGRADCRAVAQPKLARPLVTSRDLIMSCTVPGCSSVQSQHS